MSASVKREKVWPSKGAAGFCERLVYFYLLPASLLVQTLVDLREGLRVGFAPFFDGGGGSRG